MSRVERWLAVAARERPSHAALAAGPRTWSYAALEARACALAARLARAGVRAGDRVGLLADPGADAIALVHALMAAGATLVALNTRLVAAELRGLLASARPRLVIASETYAPRAQEVGAQTLAFGALDALEPEPGFAPEAQLDLDADHAILFTSGTTGEAKGVRLTYANQLASARASAQRLGVEPDDRWLLCLPVHHIGGLSIALRCAISATTAAVEPFEPSRIADLLAAEPIRLVSLVPTMLARVLDAGLANCPPALRVVLLGGGPIPSALVERCLEHSIPAAPTYGLTEAASQVATLAPAELAAAGDTAGRPLSDTELRIVREDGSPVARGEPGQILVRGPQVMRGYLDRPEASAAALAGGWLHTGDIGTLDAKGRLRVLDRREDLIVSGGENVYPAEVEAALCAHPAVREAAVVARSDPHWGQRVHAEIAAAPDSALDATVLDAWLRERLAGFKRPRSYGFRDALPRTASGKLQRAELRRALEEERRRQDPADGQAPPLPLRSDERTPRSG